MSYREQRGSAHRCALPLSGVLAPRLPRGRGSRPGSREKWTPSYSKRLQDRFCVPGTQELHVHGSPSLWFRAPQLPGFLFTPISPPTPSALYSPNCGKLAIKCLSAIAWPVMALRQACLWLGSRRLCRPLVFVSGKSTKELNSLPIWDPN